MKKAVRINLSEIKLRYAVVYISGELLQEIITEGWRVGDTGIFACTKGLPVGAKYVGEYSGLVENSPLTIGLVFSHESFDAISPGEKIPAISVEFSWHQYPDIAP